VAARQREPAAHPNIGPGAAGRLRIGPW
jgi:hypothetical protein